MRRGPEPVLESPVQSAPVPEVRNHTPYPSQYYQMLNADDVVFHVMVSRLTYDLQRLDAQGVPQLATKQAPLVDADQFYYQANTSGTVQESDYAPFKPQCDILFANARAYAPNGESLPRWPVGVRVGKWSKMLAVCGPRTIRPGVLGWSIDEPEHATEVPLRYELAFGGSAQWPEDLDDGQEPDILSRYDANPIGSGWLDKAWLAKRKPPTLRGPQIELFGQPFDNDALRKQHYPVVGLGAVGRWWSPRVDLAGSYDDAWTENRWPYLPKDFDFAYWNCAPDDQQIQFPQGGEEILLVGLTPGGGQFKAKLPDRPPYVRLRLHAGPILPRKMWLDTLTFDMQAMTLSCVYRMTVAAATGVRVLEVCQKMQET